MKTTLLGMTCGACFIAAAAAAEDFNIPAGDLKSALTTYAKQTGIPLIVSGEAIKGVATQGVKGSLSSDAALSRILAGTGFTVHRHTDAGVTIVPETRSGDVQPMQLAQATPTPRTAVETVTVTSSKLGGADVQSIPIAITALSQEQLTATQTAGGPDLVKQVPNLTFTKTNFTGYSINIRGIGTQAISVTTDPAVAVAFNDQPFIRNHFFEQEFYDVSQVEILRGPQGTLYGRNATAGVVNLTSARPLDQFEAMGSAELGNYHQRRFEGMLNIPLVDDRLDLRIAGEWTKRQGYSFNELTNQRIDGRDLWSGRVTLGWKPTEQLQTYLIWEHFSENDDRIRSSKQLCKTAPIPTEVGGIVIPPGGPGSATPQNLLSQGCLPTSLYSPDAFQVPNGFSLAYYTGLTTVGIGINDSIDPYASTTQSQNLRVIESALDPIYKAKNDIVELSADYIASPNITVSSQTAFNHDFLWATQDYNRFNTSPGIFLPFAGTDPDVEARYRTVVSGDGYFCDPQLGCSNRLVAQDLSEEHAWQLSQEFRVASKFEGPFNFSAGGNYLHYETEENYYVFINTLGLFSAHPFENVTQATADDPWIPGVTDNSICLTGPRFDPRGGYQNPDPAHPGFTGTCVYIDPNPIDKLNNQGHNYFLSQNPYTLNSYAAFGEAYYDILKDLKVIGGLRWTGDRKHFTDIPSELLVNGYGYPSTGVVDQEWNKVTGRFTLNWTPDLDFTDQSLFYGSYAHGYKAGGANPPGAVLIQYNPTDVANPVHPLTFAPEYVDAFELGSKNTLLDGALTFNTSAFYYNYKGYQISEIVDRTSINLNFDSHVKGAEIEAAWEPLPGLRFNFAGGWEDTSLANGSKAVDLIDRTDSKNHPDWMVVKPNVTQASNCILPVYVVAAEFDTSIEKGSPGFFGGVASACGQAYQANLDPITNLPYVANPTMIGDQQGQPGPGNLNGYPGFDPLAAPNNGAGFSKDLSGNELPNAPPFTVSAGAQFTAPLSSDWAGTLRGDFYWQDNSWARVFNDDPYDRIHGYTNLNIAVILTSQSGWQVMLYDKNVFNTTAITGTFLNSDDTGLPTNVFLTDPKLIGVRVTKNW